LRHSSGVRWKSKAPEARPRGPDAPSAHRRPGYPLSGCVPAEPDSVSPSSVRLASTEQCGKRPSDTGVMPQKILLYRFPTEKSVRSYPHALEKNRFSKASASRSDSMMPRTMTPRGTAAQWGRISVGIPTKGGWARSFSSSSTNLERRAWARALARARVRGLDGCAHLNGFNAYPFFEALGDAIVTGATGNNLRDLRVLLAY